MMRAVAVAVAVAAAGPAAAGAAGACVAPADVAAGRRAAAWVATQDAARMAPGQQADAIIALRAAGAGPQALRARLTRLSRVAGAYARTPGAAGKVVLATVAAGGDPADLGGVDYVARVRGGFADGRYGVTAFDQALSMLALRAAGRRVPPGAVSALRSARGPDGWDFLLRPSSRDSVDVTALVLEALAAAGVGRRDASVAAAYRWLRAQEARGGGYASRGGRGPAEGNATAAAARAICALGVPVPARTLAALRRLQAADGRVRHTRGQDGSPLLATLDAVPALLGRPLPVR